MKLVAAKGCRRAGEAILSTDDTWPRPSEVHQEQASELGSMIGIAGRCAFIALCAFLLGGCADLPLFHEPASFVGFATTPKESADFVKETRPDKTEYTSVGIEPGHPPDKPRDKEGVKQLQAELEAQRDTGHAILQKLSPGAASAQAANADEKTKTKEEAKKKAKGAAAAKNNASGTSDATHGTPSEAPAPQ